MTTPTGTITNLLTPYVRATSAATIATAYAQVLPVIPVAYAASQPERVETMALFGDARWRVADRLTLIGGFGLDRERNRYAAETQTTFTDTLPATDFLGTRYAPLVSAVNAGVLGLVDDANAPMAANTRTFHAFLPKAGVSMDWTPDLTTAFTVQRAYRSGGSSQNQAANRVGVRTVVNGQVGYQADHWNLFVFARNLLNAKYQQYNYAAAHIAVLGDPQTFGVGAGLHW
ncbi:outer membrane receptor protein involved in Fe transport [Novosphingobium sp. 1529]|uniref:TonB-dependent receptor domain-containing protein n=1 Tax=Novosphingobium sp. 1529 TaxID=3156424 RepID=UPI0033994683